MGEANKMNKRKISEHHYMRAQAMLAVNAERTADCNKIIRNARMSLG